MAPPPVITHALGRSASLSSGSDHGVIMSSQYRELYHEHCTYLPAMLGWFFFSALLSSYNKYVFGNGHMAFPCPLLLTSIHFIIQWTLSHFACELFPVTLGLERVQRMTWKEWASISIPCGLVTAWDVGLSNLSLVTITITFYTMVKSSTPIFVLFWAYWFGIEKITWPLIGVIMVIASGEFLTVAGEVDFVLHGFLLCLAASVLSGARWTLVQLKLQSLDPPLKTTLVTMRLLSPCMFLSMLFISLVLEKPWTKMDAYDQDTDALVKVFFLGSIGGILAVSMVLCEFYLILRASAIILMIGGVIKEMTTILIGVTFFGDKLNAINVTGCGVVFLGVILYKIVFHLEKEARTDEALQEKNIREGVVGKLMISEEDSGAHDDQDVEFVFARAVELVGRSNGKHPYISQTKQDSLDNDDLAEEDEQVVVRGEVV